MFSFCMPLFVGKEPLLSHDSSGKTLKLSWCWRVEYTLEFPYTHRCVLMNWIFRGDAHLFTPAPPTCYFLTSTSWWWVCSLWNVLTFLCSVWKHFLFISSLWKSHLLFCHSISKLCHLNRVLWSLRKRRSWLALGSSNLFLLTSPK